MHRTFDGPASGEGALSDWNSTRSAGRGRMFITQSLSPSSISITVDFVKPFRVRNFNEFTIEPTGALTKVTWSMQGTNLYIMRIMGLFVNMSKMVGKHFETGLKNLKTVAENG